MCVCVCVWFHKKFCSFTNTSINKSAAKPKSKVDLFNTTFAVLFTNPSISFWCDWSKSKFVESINSLSISCAHLLNFKNLDNKVFRFSSLEFWVHHRGEHCEVGSSVIDIILFAKSYVCVCVFFCFPLV